MREAPSVSEQPLFPSLDSIEAALWPGVVLLVFVVTAVLVDLMVILATRFRMVDLPNRRSAHSLPTARGGGVAIVLMACLAALAIVFRWPTLGISVLLGLVVPSLAVAGAGFIDDVRPLRPSLRLVIQIGVALAMTAVLGPLPGISLPGGFGVEFGILAWPITMLWIVGMINAYNFMDGSDGMAALGAVVVGGCMAAIGFESRALAAMLLAAFAAAAAGGFLVFNWQPARVFMGDVGSGFLGVWFAGIPLLVAEPRADWFVPITLALWPYVYDPLLSVLRRVWNGQNPLQPHREFLFHRLVRSGVSHAQAALLYGLLAALGGLVGCFMIDSAFPVHLRAWAPAVVVAMAAGLTYGIERRCRHVGLPSAATKYSSALT